MVWRESLTKLWNKIIHYPKISLVILAYIAFIALGMPDGLLGVAWPSMRADFFVPLDSLGLLLIASTTGYMSSTFLSGALIPRIGIGKLLALSCALTGAALFGNTLVPSWWMIVVLGVFVGLGAGAIDAGLNTYVATHFGEGLMQWLHASYGIGVTIGPIIMTLALTNLNSWRVGYRVVSGVQLALAVCFLLTLSWWKNQDAAPEAAQQDKLLTDYQTSLGETFGQLKVWVSFLLFFLYVGGEASLGVWTYSLLTESRGVPPQIAGFLAGSFWATFTVGRILAGLYAKRLGTHKLIQGGVALALFSAVLLWWNPFPWTNVLAVSLVGIAVAPVFPALMSATRERVGAKFAANTIGMQIAAAGLGTMVVPGVLGVLARQFSLEVIPICQVVIFLALLGLYRLSMIKNNEEKEAVS